MNSVFLDTNVLVRFVTGEPENQAKEVAKLFAAAEAGSLKLQIIPMILAEAVYVLNGFYKHSREKVSATLSHLLQCPGFQSPDNEQMLESLDLFAKTKIDFADCYLAALSKIHQTAVISFDRDFDKISGVSRKLPKDVI